MKITLNLQNLITDEQISNIKQISYLKLSAYSNLEIRHTIEFYIKRYVNQISDFIRIKDNNFVADLGAGFGWLAIAFALIIPAKILAIELDRERLFAAKKIAQILNVSDKIFWVNAGVGKLPIKQRTLDVVYCIEVIEHTYRDSKTINDLKRVSKDILIITTPNLWFPIIAHDTSLLFCHWLPINLRKLYARLFNRLDREHNNLFWSPAKLNKELQGFERVSTFAHYLTYKKYLDTFPFYNPYGSFKYEKKLSLIKSIYFRIIPKSKKFGNYFTPNLASVYKRYN